VKAGKVRAIGSSNQDEKLLGEALEISKREGIARYDTIQNHFNLYTREKFEGPVQEICVREEVSGIPYFGLAGGFLTGKYRSAADAGKSPRGQGVVDKYLNPRGDRILEALDGVAERTGAAVSEIALAWLAAQPGIAAPIASATSVAQVESLIRGAQLTLSADDLALLTEAGR
jgi:aryl-alcohol dehydrogenase-like predicted oxidoreductase